MKSLVTGGAGFIGSNLVNKLLELGHEVVVIDDESAECHDSFYWNENTKNFKTSVNDYYGILDLFKGVDYVFHLASDARIQPSILNPYNSFKNNSLGIANVLEASKINNVRKVVFSSSSSIYGNNPTPNVEFQKDDPLTPYSSAKLAGENLCKIYSNLYNLNTVSLRYFNVYGKNQPLKGPYAPVIGLFLKQKSNNLPLTIVGDGTQKRSFTHVDDIVNANIMAAGCTDRNTFGQVFNVGMDKNYSIIEIAKHISDNISFIPKRLGEGKETLPDISKIKSMIGWNPKIDLLDWISNENNTTFSRV